MDKLTKFLIVGNLAVLAVLLAGCDPMVDETEVYDDVEGLAERPGSGAGGVWLNTNAIGTKAFSEIDLTEVAHDGVRLVRVLVVGPNATWIELDRVEFHGPQQQLRGVKGTTFYTGAALVDSKWELKLISGSTQTPASMWITDYEEAEPGELRYTFHYYDQNGAPVPMCDPDPQGDVAAVPIKDIHVNGTTGDIGPRANTLYLACTSGAVGKAVNWGYKPWERTQDEFEVAVRMIRADYCYDGVSWTVPGTSVAIADKWAINAFPNPTNPTEALWGLSGLHCLASPRNALYPREQVTCGGQVLPDCPVDVDLATYNALFWLKHNPQ
jgi:hypothetical protein